MRHARVSGLGILSALAVAAAVLLVWFPPETYGFYPRCPVHAWTGLLCPGCGGTRAVAALLRGHVREAFGWNALVTAIVLCAGPTCGLLAAASRVWPERVSRASLARWQPLAGSAVLGVAAAFTVWRNLR